MMWRTRFEVPLMTYPAWKPGPQTAGERRWLSIETELAVIPAQGDRVRLFSGVAQGVAGMSAVVALVTVCPAHPGPGIVVVQCETVEFREENPEQMDRCVELAKRNGWSAWNRE